MRERFTNYITAFKLTKQHDPALWAWLLGISVPALALCLGLYWYTGSWMWIVTGILAFLVAFMWVFGWRAQRVQMSAIRGNLGAGAAILENMRGAWEFTPTVAFNRRQDFVHLLVGRPGVILVAESPSASRAQALLAKERKRYERAAGGATVHVVHVGEGPNQVDVAKLQTYVTKLPYSIKRNEIGPLNRRLASLASSKPPMPKGPVGNIRVPKNMR